MTTQLEFRARERHPFVYLATAFGVIFVAAGVSGLVVNGLVFPSVAVALLAVGFGCAVLASVAYAIWGRLRVAIGDDGWCTIAWLLGPWQRTKRFPLADLRSVRRCPPTSSAVMWASRAGPQLRLDVRHERWPVDLGGGFVLDEGALGSLEALLGRSGSVEPSKS